MERTDAKYTLEKIKELGFNSKLIKELLPEPELRENPYYRKAPKMKLWSQEDVEKAMSSPIFVEEQKKREKRKAASQKAVETKQRKTMQMIDEKISKISVQRLELDKVRYNAISCRQSWYDQIADERGEVNEYCAKMADEETVQRWMVNYIRHKKTYYDSTLYELKGKTGKGEAYLYYVKAVLDKIAEVYPELQQECMKQYQRKAQLYYI